MLNQLHILSYLEGEYCSKPLELLPAADNNGVALCILREGTWI